VSLLRVQQMRLKIFSLEKKKYLSILSSIYPALAFNFIPILILRSYEFVEYDAIALSRLAWKLGISPNKSFDITI